MKRMMNEGNSSRSSPMGRATNTDQLINDLKKFSAFLKHWELCIYFNEFELSGYMRLRSRSIGPRTPMERDLGRPFVIPKDSEHLQGILSHLSVPNAQLHRTKEE